MLFDQLFQNRQPLKNNTKKSAQQALETASNLIKQKKHKQALKSIDASLDEGIVSDQLLFKKAFLLSKEKQHDKVEKIWQELVRLEINSALASSSPEFNKKSEEIQGKNTNLINNLFDIANQYQWKLQNFPEPESYSTVIDITKWVRTEAERARTAGLPKLSINLITLSLKAGHKSAWLIHDMAISLNMMKQPKLAVELLEKLDEKVKNPALKKSIKKTLADLSTILKQNQQDFNMYMAVQAKRFAKADINIKKLSRETNVKSLILQKSQKALQTNPEITLKLANTVLDYFPSNSRALLLKASALIPLEKPGKAVSILKVLIYHQNKKIAQQARQSLTKAFAVESKLLCGKDFPEKTIKLFIQKHLQLELIPEFQIDLKQPLEKLEPSIKNIKIRELEHFRLQLAFNKVLINYFEKQLIEQNFLNDATAAQEPDSIRKTTHKAG